MIRNLTTATLLMLATPTVAQTVTINPTPVPVSVQQNTVVVQQQVTGDVLRVGAPVPVVLSEALTTKGKNLKVGQPVRLEVERWLGLSAQ